MTDTYKAGDKVTFELTDWGGARRFNKGSDVVFQANEIIAHEPAPEPESEVDKFLAANKTMFPCLEKTKELFAAIKADLLRDLSK